MSRQRAGLIRDCSPTIMFGVPLLYTKMYAGIMRQIESSKMKSMMLKYGGKKLIGAALKKKMGGRLELMVCGGAPMKPEVIRGFKKFGFEFIEGYGLTETSPIATSNRPGSVRPGSVGPPIPGVEIRIVDPDEDGVGEIAIRGDNVMQGYYREPEKTAEVLKEGWFSSGDLGKMDDDGYLYITGRAKDMIVTRGGKNVYPDYVENVINGSRYISESVVLGYRTKGLVGEDVGVLIYPDYEMLIGLARREGTAVAEALSPTDLTEEDRELLIETFRSLLEDEVRRRRDELAPHQRITRIGIEREEFTKTSTRKIKRFFYKGRLDIFDV